MENQGHEIVLHYHEDAHLGKNSSDLSPTFWTKAMKEEIELIKKTGGKSEVLFWSGGNLCPNVLKAAYDAGFCICRLKIKSDGEWKNPKSQEITDDMTGLNPWRPSGGYVNNSTLAISTHCKNCDIIYIPQGLTDTSAYKEAYSSLGMDKSRVRDVLELLKKDFLLCLENIREDNINVIHITVHPGQFTGKTKSPYQEFEDFLVDFLNPLVEQGKVRWATFSEKAKFFEDLGFLLSV